ncbi:unnamed protein product [Diamesa hyperborea]
MTSQQTKTVMTVKILSSEESRNFLKTSVINGAPKATTSTISAPKATFSSLFQPQPSTSRAIVNPKPVENKPAMPPAKRLALTQPSKEHPAIAKPALALPAKVQPAKKQPAKFQPAKAKLAKANPVNGKKITKIEMIEQQLEGMSDEEKAALCMALNSTEIEQNDIKCEIEHIVATQFQHNRIMIEGQINEPKWGKEGRPDFMKMISKALKTPKFNKAAAAKAGTNINNHKAEAKVEASAKDVKPRVKKASILDGIIPTLGGSYFRNYNSVMMRFHRLQNMPEQKLPKMKAADLNMTYNAKMARKPKKPVFRTIDEQRKREKNTIATRVSRMRLKYEEEQIQFRLALYENWNMDYQRKNACLMTYINMLLEINGEEKVDLMKITEDMLALDFKKEQDQLARGELEDHEGAFDYLLAQ